jgi:hypothetical protein
MGVSKTFSRRRTHSIPLGETARGARLISDFVSTSMEPNTRTVVAYIAVRLISGQNASSIYDFSRSEHIPIGGVVNRGHVQVYDYERNAHISGSGNGINYSLFDYGQSSHISLTINGNNFRGYDYGTGNHFSGSVRGRSVSFYDYGESSYFSFSI